MGKYLGLPDGERACIRSSGGNYLERDGGRRAVLRRGFGTNYIDDSNG